MAKDKKRKQSKYRAKYDKRENLAKWLRARGIGAFRASNEKGKRTPLPMPMLQALKDNYESEQLEQRASETVALRD